MIFLKSPIGTTSQIHIHLLCSRLLHRVCAIAQVHCMHRICAQNWLRDTYMSYQHRGNYHFPTISVSQIGYFPKPCLSLLQTSFSIHSRGAQGGLSQIRWGQQNKRNNTLIRTEEIQSLSSVVWVQTSCQRSQSLQQLVLASRQQKKMKGRAPNRQTATQNH